MDGWMVVEVMKCSQGFVIKACLLWSIEVKDQSHVDPLIIRCLFDLQGTKSFSLGPLKIKALQIF